MISDVTVVDGLVRWRSDGEAAVVCVGRTPDAIDHEHPAATVPAGRNEVQLDLPPGRHYVSVAPADGGSAALGAERRIALEGALNVRDLGGYPTADGRTTRWGRVFRSDGLHALTEADVDVMAGLGLQTVFDLRRDVERERRPSVAHTEGVEAMILAIGDAGPVSQQPELLDMVLSGELPEADDQFMIGEYRRMLDDHGGEFGRLLAGLAEPGNLPALFHCTAGKDRTGVAAALLLLLLGVDRELVLDDYELTNIYRSNRRIAELTPQLEAAGVDVEKVRPFLSARRPVLEGALDHVGDVEAYLLGPAGMDRPTLDRLRAALLTPG